MFKNHLKIAWRSLKKQPFFTFLNIFGLAIGMAGGLLISLYIYDELSFDKMFLDAERIHRINVDVKFGGEAMFSAEASAPMAEALKNDFAQVENSTRLRDQGSRLMRKENSTSNIKEENTAFADENFFEFFGLELLHGDVNTALKEPNTLVLTETAANKHFPSENALGQTLILSNNETYRVTGVMEDLPKNSMLREHAVFMAMVGHEDAWEGAWGSHNYFTFIKVIPEANMAAFQEPLQSMLGTYVIPYVQRYFPGITEEQFRASGNYLNFSTIPLTDIHLHSNAFMELSANSKVENIYILTFIALFLILLASVNFMNLSTAHSLKRAKEVGVRKTLGSNKRELIRQFLTESGMVSLISLALAISVAWILLPFFNDLAGKDIKMPFTSPFFWLILFAATTLLSLFSGSYPAFFMSRFMPVDVLKGGGTSNVGGSAIRNSLVVFQFTISVLLIIGTIVVYQQLNFIQNKDLGYSKEQVLVVNDVFTVGDQVQTFKREVDKLTPVAASTLSSYLPTPSARSNTSFFQEGAEEQENAINMQQWFVDHDYINTLDLEILAGRNFDREFKTDSTAMLLNETTVSVLGISPEEALGMRISGDLGAENPEYFTVIGVIKNFHFSSLRDRIGSLSMVLGDFSSALSIRLNTSNFPEAIASIENIWNQVAPGQPFDYYFLDESFNQTYEAEQRLGKIFIIFTLLSLLIACLGLFGLAAFNAEKRTKEIGVRKVMGANIRQIAYGLTLDFLKLVGLAIIIALPLGWLAMSKWLEDFTYRTNIGVEVFIFAALIAVLIAIITVSYQSIKAAIVNPVKSLRTE